MPAETPIRPIRTAGVTRAVSFDLRPGAAERAALAADLGILGVRKLRFTGALAPDGAADLRLDANLGATVVQACVVTLAPVTTRIDEQVIRRYLAEMPPLPDGEEVEMPEDDTAEPLPATLDPRAVMAEALALSLPPWPRAEGVPPADAEAPDPGAETAPEGGDKPFAALRELRDRLSEEDPGED